MSKFTEQLEVTTTLLQERDNLIEERRRIVVSMKEQLEQLNRHNQECQREHDRLQKVIESYKHKH